MQLRIFGCMGMLKARPAGDPWVFGYDEFADRRFALRVGKEARVGLVLARKRGRTSGCQQISR